MIESVERLMLSNLLDVFNERDEAKRRAAIERTYAADVHWTDAEGVTSGWNALDAKCAALQRGIAGQQFVADGPVHELTGFAYLAWRLTGDTSGQPALSGFDVALISEGLITRLYTVLHAAA